MKRNLLNEEYLKEFITTNQGPSVKYRWSHGATDFHLGDGLLVYALIQFKRAKTCVCIGSGGGFIPRIMTQARQDLYSQNIFEGSDSLEWGDIGTTIVVDANNGVGGNIDWKEEDSFLRKHFHPRVILESSQDAYYNFFVKEDIKIDYLHIDGDHSFEGVKKDFELYSNLVTNDGIISIHDTDRTYSESHIIPEDTKPDHLSYAGPAQFVEEMNLGGWQKFDLFNHKSELHQPSSTGLTLLRKIH